MKKSGILLLVLVALLFEGCAKIYYTPDSRSLAQSHKMIAIAPPKVSIAARKNIDAEAIKEQQRTESINFQKEMYSWLLKRKMQGKIMVEIQDVETTNAMLSEAGYFDGKALTPKALCELLQVDAVMTSNYALTKPMSEGAAIAVAVLVGAWGATNQTTVDLAIHDLSTNKMIFNYNHKAASSMGSAAQLVDDLMRQASKKLPYVVSQ